MTDMNENLVDANERAFASKRGESAFWFAMGVQENEELSTPSIPQLFSDWYAQMVYEHAMHTRTHLPLIPTAYNDFVETRRKAQQRPLTFDFAEDMTTEGEVIGMLRARSDDYDDEILVDMWRDHESGRITVSVTSTTQGHPILLKHNNIEQKEN